MQLGSGCGAPTFRAPGYFFYTDPDLYKREAEIELERKLRVEGDPQQPPPRRPGDRYLIGGAIVGVVVGCAGGSIVAWAYPGLPVVILVVGGIIVGGLLGLFIGDRLKKSAVERHRLNKERRA